MLNLCINEIDRLVKKYGCPLYVFDEKSFVDNYKELMNAFQTVYPKYIPSYSYKTNYTPYVCNLVKNLGGYAEVVSGMEYHIAKKLEYDSSRIIFNGPNKGVDGIDAVRNGSIVNVDNLCELKNLIDCLYGLQGIFQIGLRINLDLGQSFVSRFGMDEEDVSKAFSMVSEVENLEIVGLHCHISRCRSLAAWKNRSNIMLKLADQYFGDKLPQYIDLGSGMFGKMDESLEKQFDEIPTYEQYAEVTAALFADHYKAVSTDKKPILFTEPGTTLINKYFDFIGRVDSIKSIRGKSFVVMNCSEHNLGETCLLKKLPIRVISSESERISIEHADLVGYTCLEQDVMYTDFDGQIGIGDYIQFGNVGGYSNVYKPPFIWPNCSMIVIDSLGNDMCIKNRESYNDLLNTYLF